MTLEGFWSEVDQTPFSADAMNACLLQIGEGPPDDGQLGYLGQRYFDNVNKKMYRDNGSSWDILIDSNAASNIPSLRTLTLGGSSPYNHAHIGGPSEFTGDIITESDSSTQVLVTSNISDYPSNPINPWHDAAGEIALVTPTTTNINSSKLVMVDLTLPQIPGGASAGSDILDVVDGNRGWRISADDGINSAAGNNIRISTELITIASILSYNEQFVLKAYPVWNLPEVAPVLSNTLYNLTLRFTYTMKVMEITTALVI